MIHWHSLPCLSLNQSNMLIYHRSADCAAGLRTNGNTEHQECNRDSYDSFWHILPLKASLLSVLSVRAYGPNAGICCVHRYTPCTCRKSRTSITLMLITIKYASHTALEIGYSVEYTPKASLSTVFRGFFTSYSCLWQRSHLAGA